MHATNLFILIFSMPVYAVLLGQVVPAQLRSYVFITLWLIMILIAAVTSVYISN
jgi:Fe2+ transport system protein B